MCPPATEDKASQPRVPDRHVGLDGRAGQAAAAEARLRACWSISSAPTTRCRSSSMPVRPAWCWSRPRRPTRRRSSAALENLSAGGSTAGAEGIELAYRLAEQNKVDGGVNRVILATDGDFNVGIDDPEELKTFIKAKRDERRVPVGARLRAGQSRRRHDAGAGAERQRQCQPTSTASRKPRRCWSRTIGGTLETIAKDVKIQVEFNPAVVAEYRLIGYETRALNREDFNNDKVDAGEIGAGTTVTAIYEITPVGSGAELDRSAALRQPTRRPPACGRAARSASSRCATSCPTRTTSAS